MKVLFYIDSLIAGGKERRFVELMKALCHTREIEFEIVLMSNDIHYREVLELNIKIHYLIRTTKKDITIFHKLYKLCKTIRPDLVHCWDSMTAVYSAPVCKMQGIILVNGMVVDTPVRRNIFNKYWLRAKITFPFSTVVIGNSNAGLKAYGAPSHRSLCIYNGMDLRRFEALKDVKLMKKEILGAVFPEVFIVGMVAAFEERKDYHTFINAAISLVSSNDVLRFVLVGEGITFQEMKLKVPAQLNNRILFLGKRSDVESIVNIFDIGVLMTNALVHGEGISNSIIEYMALSKPVLATRGGGTDELVFDGHNGYLLDSGDQDQLENKIEFLMKNHDLRSDIGINGRRMVIEKFDLRKMAKEYISLYVSLSGN